MMIGIGIDARIVEGIDPRLKRASGKFAYVWSGVRAIVQHRPPAYRLVIDGKPYDAAAAIIAKGHFYGGRFVVARDARLDTPTLHAVLMQRPGRWNVVRYGVAIALGAARSVARCARDRSAIHHGRGPRGETAQADGDLAGRPAAGTITVAERPLLH